MTKPPVPNAWCEIFCDRISRNIELALSLLPDKSQFCAVLKGDAYGHGINQVVPLVMEQGIECIGISSNEEAQAVRRAGFAGRLLRVRTASPLEIIDALPQKVEEQVSTAGAAAFMRDLVDQGKYQVGVHLSLNANGMSRDGLEISNASGKAQCEKTVEHLKTHIVGICTHFPSNDPKELSQSADQFQKDSLWVIENGGLSRSDLLVHAGSSLTLVSDHKIQTDMYRCGAILYGILKPEWGFRPTMALKSRIVSIGEYPSGSTVGYDRSIALNEDKRLACVSIGYANGFRRNSLHSAVDIGGVAAPIVGKISMNTLVADVSHVDDAQVGDEVAIFGEATAITMTAVEQQFETILADLFCDWGLRNTRFYSSSA